MNRNVEQLYRDALLLLLASPSERGCRKDIHDLYHQLGVRKCQNLGVRDTYVLKQYLDGCTKLFEVENHGRLDVSVIPKTSLTICRNHSNKSGSCPEHTCLDLHFCIFYLLSGQCGFGNHCLFGHDLTTLHNQKRLERHLLGRLNLTELRTLFALPGVRQGVTIPQVCRYYNKKKGCSRGQDCRCVHLCLHYVQDQCKFASSCLRNHDINHPQVVKVLTSFGVRVRGRKYSDILKEVKFYNQRHEEELDSEAEECGHRPWPGVGAGPRRSGSVPNLFRGQNLSIAPQLGLQQRQRAPSVDRRPRTSSESCCAQLASGTPYKTDKICLYFLRGMCRFGDKCHQLHCDAPYEWRLISADPLTEGGGGFLPSNSNQLLERAFSQPHNTACTVKNLLGDDMEVEFQNMTAQNMRTNEKYRVRRISTQSSEDSALKGSKSGKNGNADLATVWLWYWRNQLGVWSEFGAEESERLPVTSNLVEEYYQRQPLEPMVIDSFLLDLGKMHLKDVFAGSKFKVRRRPLLQVQNNAVEYYSTNPRSDSGSSGINEDSYSEDEDDDKDDQARASSGASNIFGNHGGRAENGFSSVVSSPIHPMSSNFLSIKQKFLQTLGVSCTVLRIDGVENPQLEARYKRMKSQLATQSRKQRVRDVQLYYGPSPDEDIDAICASGVDCDHRHVVVNGLSLGRGGGFHVNAGRARADKSVKSRGELCMFVMKCLVGRVSGVDCRVDDKDSPKTYVISNPSQVCPQFIITYRLS